MAGRSVYRLMNILILLLTCHTHFVIKLTSARNDLSEEQLEKLFSSING